VSAPAAVEPLLAGELGSGGIAYAPGVRAGPWVFANGVVASDLGAEAGNAAFDAGWPQSGRPHPYREALALLGRAQAILASGGADLSRCVRLDQFYPRPEAVAFYQRARRDVFGGYIAPSTSIVERALIVPDASISVDFMALRADAGGAIETFYPPALEVPAGAGFAPVVRAGGFVFVAGMLAAHQPGDLGGIAPEARMPAGHLWKGIPIELEADYIMARKIKPALEAAGLGFADVVKVQAYLSDMADVPAFNEVWNKWLSGAHAVRSFIPTAKPGFAVADAHVEINVLALCPPQRAEPVGAGWHTPYAHDPVAVRCGDFILLSGLMAIDEDGPVAGVRRDPLRPWFDTPIEAQMRCIVARARAVCEQAGVPLANAVRIQHFHTDLAEFHPSCRAWQQALSGAPLPISAIEVPAPLAHPACSVQADLWIYAPGAG
jgi:enamine deaminase RidA (YjgF/YER057c/UK114 family)